MSNNLDTQSQRGIVSVICMLVLLCTVVYVAHAQEAPTAKKAAPSPKEVDQPKTDAESEKTPTTQPAKPEKTPTLGEVEEIKSGIGSGPIIIINEPEHDFGVVWVGNTLDHIFEIRNEGVLPLEIQNVKPSCGCTVAKNYDKVIQPDSVGRIPVILDSSKLRGKFNKIIKVTSNDKSNSTMTLRVKGLVKHYVVAKPSRASFGSMKPNTERTQKIKLTNESDQPMELSLAKKNLGKCFSAELVETVAGQEYELLISIKRSCKEGRNGVKIEINTNIPQQKVVTVSANAHVRPRLHVNPDQLVISRARSRESKKNIKIINNSNAPIHLLGATADEEKLTLTTKEIKPGLEYRVDVTIAAGYRPDAKGNTITLKFDDPEKPVVEVPVLNTFMRRKPAMQLLGQRAPAAEFVTHEGTRIDITDIKDQALVLKFYASWCKTCKLSLPNIEKAYQQYKDKGVRFIGVNQDNSNDPRKSKRFTPEQSLAMLKELGVTFDVSFDPEKRIGRMFKADSYPTMFLINKSGKVVNVYIGAVRGSKFKVFTNDLDKLLVSQRSKVEKTKGAQATTETQ